MLYGVTKMQKQHYKDGVLILKKYLMTRLKEMSIMGKEGGDEN